MKVSILADHEQMSIQAADLFVKQAIKSVKEDGRFCVAISGGDTPLRTYELLGQKPWVDLMPWKETHIFWGDERCVNNDDPRHNAFIVKNILLSHVQIPEEQVHPIICSENPYETALRYEALIRSFFHDKGHLFDLIMLGVGGDGHVASIFPGTLVVEERKRLVVDVSVPGQAFKRITLTLPAIEKSKIIMFMVSGISKATVLSKIFKKNGKKNEFPAGMIKPEHNECIWLIDEAAGSKLK